MRPEYSGAEALRSITMDIRQLFIKNQFQNYCCNYGCHYDGAVSLTTFKVYKD